MPGIKKLSAELIGLIAAGEVVERPASAVKELVENSIDAGAASVTVELREGGVRYLRVSDNGRGIPAEQIRLAFERHATSKLVKAEDLYDIRTLGFRGEALASIAAVAKVTCTTRTEDAAFGTRATVEAGEFTDIRQAASPVGTTIVVENLFENAPVRLKFLKKPSLEASLVSDYMLRLILSRPDISFRFVSQGKTIYRSMGDGSVESALYCLYGGEALKQMRKVHGHLYGVLVDGFVGVGELSRGNRQQQSFFVNGRYFRSPLMSKALENGCEGRVMIGRFPMCALFLKLPGRQVDVNVHPNKLEVRFQNELNVAEAVETLVREAMRSESLGARLSAAAQDGPGARAASAETGFTVVPVGEPADGQNAAAPAERESMPKQPFQAECQPVVSPLSEHSSVETRKEPKEDRTGMPASISVPAMRLEGMALSETVMPRPNAELLRERYQEEAGNASAGGLFKEPSPERPALLEAAGEQGPVLRMVGIVFDTYWIFEAADRLLLVDQHAAHERILYDRMMARFEGGHISQRLLSPQLVRLTARDMALAAELTPVLRDAGFEIEPFDDTCVAVHAVPTLFGRNDSPRELLLEALDECQDGRGQATRERMRRQVAQMACKRAIKGGDKLSGPEIEGFLRSMLESGSMPTCPHGRPIVTEITRYALEKRFKRIQ